MSALVPTALVTAVTTITLTLREQCHARRQQAATAYTARRIQELEEEIERLKREMRACGITVPQSR
jgi:hypothetical protein